MITDEKLKYLKVIFFDADILDADFSKWDDAISIYVVADHVQLPGSQKRTLLAIRFLRVRRFDGSTVRRFDGLTVRRFDGLTV